MALPTSTELIAYLRIESEESSAESGLLTAFVTRATAMVEAWLDRPILSLTSQVFVDEAVSDRGYVTKLLVPVTPIKTATVVIVDKDGVTVPSADYRINLLTGEIFADPGVRWSNGPYTITCTVGLADHPRYSARIEAILSQAILDVAADLYHARNPRSASESAGGGASTTYVNQCLPERVQVALQPYRNWSPV